MRILLVQLTLMIILQQFHMGLKRSLKLENHATKEII